MSFANVVVFLASDESRLMNGVGLVLDQTVTIPGRIHALRAIIVAVTTLEIAMKALNILSLAVCVLAGSAAWSADEPKTEAAAKPAPAVAPAPEASIPFANHNGIYTWQVENTRSLLIQGQNRKWYRATLMSSCFDLPFAEEVAFETNPSGSFDKFSAVRVKSQRCPGDLIGRNHRTGKKAQEVQDRTEDYARSDHALIRQTTRSAAQPMCSALPVWAPLAQFADSKRAVRCIGALPIRRCLRATTVTRTG